MNGAATFGMLTACQMVEGGSYRAGFLVVSPRLKCSSLSFMGELTRVGYDGPLCIEVEGDNFGKTLEG